MPAEGIDGLLGEASAVMVNGYAAVGAAAG